MSEHAHYVVPLSDASGSSSGATCAIRPKVGAPPGESNGGVSVSVLPAAFTCAAQDGDSCASSANFRIKTPASVTVHTTDPTNSLDRIVSAASATCDGSDGNDTPYQSARVVVYADGADVTPLATGLHIPTADASRGKFVRAAGAASWNSYEGQDATLVRGKAAGTFAVKLYDDAQLPTEDGTVTAPSVSIAVTDNAVYAVEKRAFVVTGLVWEANSDGTLIGDPSTKASGYNFAQTPAEASFDTTVVAEQVFRQRPVTGKKSHYGYLFNVITFNDTAEEEVLYGEMAVTTTSSNIRVTCAGTTCKDDHAGNDLTLYNYYTNRYMVSISKSAITECVDGGLEVKWERCGVEVAKSYPVVHVKMPDPVGIEFKILNDGDRPGGTNLFLTPAGGAGAAFAGARASTTSKFQLTVQFRDFTADPPFSEVTTYADAPNEDGVLNITYRSLDTACATVDNDANELTVVQGATCHWVQIEVTITLSDKFTFVATDVARVVRASHVATLADAYPGGTTNIPPAATTRRLPCFASADASASQYERYTLRTYAWLEHEAAQNYTIDDLMHSTIFALRFDISGFMDWNPSGTSDLGSELEDGAGADNRIGVKDPSGISGGATTGYAVFGAQSSEFASGAWVDFEHIPVHSFKLHINPDVIARTFNSDTDTKWKTQHSTLPGDMDLAVINGANTFNREPEGTLVTTFAMKYTRADAVPGGPSEVTFAFDDLMHSAYNSWFDYRQHAQLHHGQCRGHQRQHRGRADAARESPGAGPCAGGALPRRNECLLATGRRETALGQPPPVRRPPKWRCRVHRRRGRRNELPNRKLGQRRAVLTLLHGFHFEHQAVRGAQAAQQSALLPKRRDHNHAAGYRVLHEGSDVGPHFVRSRICDARQQRQYQPPVQAAQGRVLGGRRQCGRKQ